LAVTTVPTDFSQGEAAAATRALLAPDERPTAIVCDSDVAALAGTTGLAEAGLGVPRDVSGASSDDSQLLGPGPPAVTAVPGHAVPDVVAAPTPALTVRGSTGAVPGAAS